MYWSITAGVPAQREGTVKTNIWRHASDRKRMAVYPFEGHRGKTAVSTYRCACAPVRTRAFLYPVFCRHTYLSLTS